MIATGHVCDKSSCPALAAQEVELYEADFYFCQHHFNELEPTFIGMLALELVDA